MKLDGVWIDMPTTFISEDSAYYYYESEVSSFSTFAIVADKSAQTPSITGKIIEEPEEEMPEEEREEIPEAKTKKSNIWVYFILGIIVIDIIIITILTGRRKPKRR